MKKIVKWIMLALAVLTVTFTLVACDGCSPNTPPPGGGDDDPAPGTQHVHEYSNDWSKNETGHWHISTCEHTGLKTEVIAHDYAVETVSVRTCTSDGETKYECKDCHYVKTVTEKAGHTVPTELHVAAVAATCLSEGNIEYWQCKDCHKLFGDAAFTTEITRADIKTEQLTHEWQTKSTVQPTCTTYGMTLQECKNCHEEQEINVVAAVDHTWSKAAVTCTEGRECTVCHTHEDASGHKYSAIRVTYADCVSDGMTTYKCDYCADSYETVTSHATGHNVTTWELQTVSSLSNANITVDYPECTYVRVGHCENDGCSAQVVDAENPMVSHVYRTVLATAATCVSGGTKTHNCMNCNYHYDESIPINPIAHHWDSGAVNGKITTYHCAYNGCNETKTTINATNEVSTQVTAEDLHNEIALQNASIQLDSASINGLSGSSFTVQASPAEEYVDTGEYNNNTVYDFTLGVDGDPVTTFDGEVTVRIPYLIGADEDPDNIAILYIDEHGEISVIDAQWIDGYAVFKTNHFSYYTVTRLTNEQRCAKYGHSWNGQNGDGYVVAATCTTGGYTQKKCLRCQHEERSNETQKLGHNMQETVKAALTCTTSGRVEHACSRCAYKYTVVTPAQGHDFETVKEVKATCTASGYIDVKCKHCDESHRNVLVQLRHNYERQVTEPTCLASGYTTYTCLNCAKSYTDDITPATGHDYVVTTLVAATCLTGGLDTHVCKYCAQSYVDITPATGHTWDIDEPNCGKGQTCVSCGISGKPAVGEHTMVNGVCSVCGTGCTHNFVEVRVAPDCETAGSLTKACEHCGIVESTSVLPALGHTDGIKCDTCGKELIEDGFFVNTLKSMASTSYTLRLADFKVNIVTESGAESQTIAVEELYLGMDEDGELCAYGKGTMSYTDASMPVEAKQTVIIAVEKGMFYASVDMVGIKGQNDYNPYTNYNAYKISNESEKTYIKASLDSLEGSSEFAQMAMAAKIYAWYRTEFVTLIDNVLAANKTDINAFIKTLIGKLFTVSANDNGFTLTLNADGVKEISDALAKGTVKKAADEIFGEDTFDKFTDTVEDLLGRNLGLLLQDMTLRGVDIDELLDSADSLLNAIMGCTLTEMFEQMLGIELDVREIIADEDNMSKTVLQIVAEKMENDELTADMILDEIVSAGNKAFYTLIGGDKNAATEVIDELVDMAKKGLTLRLQLDKNGYLTSGSIACDVDDKMGVFMTDRYNPHYEGTLEILLGKVTKYDYKTLTREIDAVFAGFELTREKTGDYWSSRNANVVYGDDGSVRSASYTVKKARENNSFNDKEFTSDKNAYRLELLEEGHTDFTVSVLRQDIREVSVTFGENPMLMARQDCGNWYIVGVMGRISSAEHFNAVLLVATDNTTGEVIGEKKLDTFVGGTSGDYDGFYEFFYNKYSHMISSDEIDYESSRHKYVEDTTKAVEPVGCSTPGKRVYNCSACGKSYTLFYANGHKRSKIVYSSVFDTEDKNCESGVTMKAVCTDCGDTLWQDHVDYHRTVSVTVPLQDFGASADCEGYLEYYYCSCKKHSGGYVIPGKHEFDRREIEYKGDGNYTFVNTCAVTSPACGFRFAEKHYTVGCVEYVTYIFDCTENGGKKASSYEYTFVYTERHVWHETGRVSAGEPCFYTITERCEKCGETRTENGYIHDPEKETMREEDEGHCRYRIVYMCGDCGNEIYAWSETRHDLETLYAPTCSQCGINHCKECGETVRSEPKRHDFRYDADKNYVCINCGLENRNGATGMITLEDMTEDYGNGEYYVVGYYCEKYGFNEQRYVFENFAVVVSLVTEGSDEDTPIEVYADKYYKENERGGNANLVAVSKNSVADRAAAAGLTAGSYQVRIAFVPMGGGGGSLDYAITLDAGV